MSGKLTIQELEDKLIERTGISRKLAGEWLHALPAVIEESLISDGEARVRGLGTFKLRWTERRLGRNLRTREPMEIPAHNRVVFTPESKLRDRVNEDFKFLSYRVIGDSSQQRSERSERSPDLSGSAVGSEVSEANGVQTGRDQQRSERSERSPDLSGSAVSSDIPVAISQPPKANGQRPTANADQPLPPAPGTPRKRIHWLYPLVFFILVILAVVFYFRNCRGPLVFPLKEKSEQEFKPSVTPQPALKPSAEDSVSIKPDTMISEPHTGEEQPATPPSPSTEPGKPPPMTGEQPFSSAKTVVTQGDWLFQLAREHYGNPFLWTLIYANNKALINDPQNVLNGITIVIPALEGTGKKLSRNDSLRVAEGYRLVTEYYLSKGETTRADEYRQGISRYNPR